VTLNLGLRYEFFTVPKDKNGLDAYLPDNEGYGYH